MRLLSRLTFSLLFVCFAVFVPRAQANLVFAKTTIKTDTVPTDGIIVAAFPFTNTGEATVTINEVASSCGCTVPELTKKVYAPGEKGVITAKFTVGDRQGLQTKLITVHSDAGAQLLKIEATLPVRLSIVPRLAIFRGASPAPITMHLTFDADAPVKLIGVDSTNANFAVTVKTNTEGRDYTLTVSMLKTSAQNERANIRIRTQGASGLAFTDMAYAHYTP